MKRATRQATKKNSPTTSNNSNEEKHANKKVKTPSLPKKKYDSDSSSASDIEDYLQPANQIDLNSSYFQTSKLNAIAESNSFEDIEKNILGSNSLMNDQSESEGETDIAHDSTQVNKESRIHFQHLYDYTKKLEDAREHVQRYKANQQLMQVDVKPDDSTILSMLNSVEATTRDSKQNALHHSSGFYSSSDSEKDDWEEVEQNDEDEGKSDTVAPKQGVEIVLELPNQLKKKKGTDLMASLKRKLNRIKKENQVYIHKVHLLCWIAHGNYVNQILNTSTLLALALSIIPSQHCYPKDRVDLSYLEQIVQWYSKAVPITNQSVPTDLNLLQLLNLQITKKEAFNKIMHVYIFICLLRSLGIQIRLVLSFQVVPLRPDDSELCSLSVKTSEKKISHKNEKSTEKEISVRKNQKSENNSENKQASTSGTSENKTKIQSTKKDTNIKIRDKSTDSNKTMTSDKNKVKSEKKLAQGSRSESADKGKDKRSSIRSRSEKTSKPDHPSKQKVLENTRNLRSRPSSEKTESKTTQKIDSNVNDADTKKTRRGGINSKFSKPEKLRMRSSSSLEDKSRSSLKSKKTKSNSQSVEKHSKKSPTKILQVDGIDDSTDEESTSVHKNVSTNSRSLRKRSIAKIPNYAENSDNGGDFTPDSSDSGKEFSIACSDSESSDEEHFIERPPKAPNLSQLASFKSKITNTKCKSTMDSKSSNVDLSKLKKSLPDFSNILSPHPETSTKSKPPNLQNLIKAKQLDVRNDIVQIMTKRIAQESEIAKNKLVKNSKVRKMIQDNSLPSVVQKRVDSEDEFREKLKQKVKRRIPVKKDESGKVVPDESGTRAKKQGTDVWVEVFVESEEKWISADVTKGKVHCIKELSSRASHPVCYTVVWNNDNSIKDVTKRYCTQWNTLTRKLRIDSKWWAASLRPFQRTPTIHDREEDEDLDRIQSDQPLPTTITEYKDHPLYVLQRHLLKFQAIYPPDQAPIGFIRKEPVYPRTCVFVLHSRDIWLKSAKVVRLGEKPYKIVKARPKYDKLSGKVVTDQLLEIFGPWQVQDYEPPHAANGIVPRNAYGNVDLFKSSMLPIGTVHLQLPGLNKVAKKLGVDCAPAVVGFDFHGGWSHPTFDGFVVCEEHQDSVIAAWYAEQEEAEKREEEKIEKRVYGNWKRLIKALLIRERLQKRYDFQSTTSQGTKRSKEPKKEAKKLCPKSNG